jgi:hypothetical protein
MRKLTLLILVTLGSLLSFNGCASVRDLAIALDKTTRLTPEDVAEVDAWMARQPSSYIAHKSGDGYVITPHYASYRKAHEVRFLDDAVAILKARDYPVIYK